MQEEKQKSRKSQIVKDIAKKDKFEKEPIITDTTVKTDNLQ